MLHKRPEIMERIKQEQAGNTGFDEQATANPTSSDSWPDVVLSHENHQANRATSHAEEQLPRMMSFTAIVLFVSSSILVSILGICRMAVVDKTNLASEVSSHIPDTWG